MKTEKSKNSISQKETARFVQESSKILRYASCFQLSSRFLEMYSNTVFHVWYITCRLFNCCNRIVPQELHVIATVLLCYQNWESFLSDGLHLSKEGNRFVADHVIPLLDTKLGHLPKILPDWKDIDPKHIEKALL